MLITRYIDMHDVVDIYNTDVTWWPN